MTVIYSGESNQVEFEARTAEACDFHGVKALLHKLFEVGGPAAMSGEGAVSLSELADLVINQRSVGSVITQSRRQQVNKGGLL